LNLPNFQFLQIDFFPISKSQFKNYVLFIVIVKKLNNFYFRLETSRARATSLLILNFTGAPPVKV